MWGAWSDRGEPRQLLILSVSICALLFQFYFVDRTYSHFALLLVRTLTPPPPPSRKPLKCLGEQPWKVGGCRLEIYGIFKGVLEEFDGPFRAT